MYLACCSESCSSSAALANLGLLPDEHLKYGLALLMLTWKSIVVAALLLSPLCLLPSCGGPELVERQPNIVLVLVDDLGTEGLGCYGGLSIPTPRIDGLATEGARYTQAHTTPLCTPTRVRLMTGRGGLQNYVDFGTLHPDEVTFAQQLKKAGYETGVVGKWQLLGDVVANKGGESSWTGSSPSHAGFESWCLWQTESRGSRYFDPTLDFDGQTQVLDGQYGPDVFVEWAEAFIAQERSAPFLLYYPMVLPHDPFVGTPGSLPDSSPELEDETESERNQRYFEDMARHIDVVIGRLLDQIEELGIAEQTLFVFATDNSHSRHVMLTAEGREYGGRKYITNDFGTRVPLIVRWPGRINSKQEVGDLVDLMDLMPTLIEAGGAELPQGVQIDGDSLLPTLIDGAAWDREALTFWYHPRPHAEGAAESRWARGQRFKLYGDGRLFDLDKDPLEGRPLLIDTASGPAQKARIKLQAHLDALPERPARVLSQ